MPDSSERSVWWLRNPLAFGQSRAFRTEISLREGSRAGALFLGRHNTGKEYGVDLPRKLIIDPEKSEQDNLRLWDIFSTSGYLVVSGRVKHILTSFNMVDVQLAGIDLYKSNTQSKFEGDWYFCNPTVLKGGFEPELSQNFMQPLAGGEGYLGAISGLTGDGDIKVNTSVLRGADIWRDPRLKYQLFLSDDLFKALKSEETLGSIIPLRCIVQ